MKNRKYQLFIYSKHPANLTIIKGLLQEKNILDENTYKKMICISGARVSEETVYEIADNREKYLLYKKILVDGMFQQVWFFHELPNERVLKKISRSRAMDGVRLTLKALDKILNKEE